MPKDSTWAALGLFLLPRRLGTVCRICHGQVGQWRRGYFWYRLGRLEIPPNFEPAHKLLPLSSHLRIHNSRSDLASHIRREEALAAAYSFGSLCAP